MYLDTWCVLEEAVCLVCVQVCFCGALSAPLRDTLISCVNFIASNCAHLCFLIFNFSPDQAWQCFNSLICYKNVIFFIISAFLALVFSCFPSVYNFLLTGPLICSIFSLYQIFNNITSIINISQYSRYIKNFLFKLIVPFRMQCDSMLILFFLLTFLQCSFIHAFTFKS